ncbi:MAG: ABC transporter permease/substrate-binding protein [Bacteroidota bacterium]
MQAIRDFIGFIGENSAELLEQTLEHLWLTLIALMIATAIGLSLGILITRVRGLSSSVIGFVNAVQTIPSIALLGFMIPLLGIGEVPAIVALFLYALLPIVRNTFAGIEEVEPGIKEAARGMGLSNRQLLLKVELPLALPVIFAGIRTAFVINVGVATLCALIAAGGLGEFIFRGLTTNNTYMILAGAIPAALMALVFDFILGKIQQHILSLIKPLAVGLGVIIVGFSSFYLFQNNQKPAFTGGFPSEFIYRGDGYQGLKAHYDLQLETVELEIGLMYQALKNEKVDVISGFSTDGRIETFNLRVLEDDKQYFPPYHATALVSGQTLEKYPELREVFARLGDRISDKKMAQLNNRVDKDKLSPKKAAEEFLANEGFKTDAVKEGEADIIIGSKNFTENYILAQMFKILIENYTSLTVETKLGFGGTKLVFDALDNGEIDLYPEYTGTGLLVLLNASEEERKSIQYDKLSVLNYVKKEIRDRHGMEWMPPLGFNNTFALMMREEQAEELNIKTISDLSEYLKNQ